MQLLTSACSDPLTNTRIRYGSAVSLNSGKWKKSDNFCWKNFITSLGHKADTAFIRMVLIALNLDTYHMGMIYCMHFNDCICLYKIFHKENSDK